MYSLSSSSWNGFCNAYATCHGGTWYGLLIVFSCKENMPSKNPIPLNTPSNSLCICCVDSALFLLSLSQLEPARKLFVDLSQLVLTVDFVLLLEDFKMLSVFAQHLMTQFVSCSVLDPWTVFMFSYCSLLFACSASIESVFMLIMWRPSVSDIPNNA